MLIQTRWGSLLEKIDSPYFLLFLSSCFSVLQLSAILSVTYADHLSFPPPSTSTGMLRRSLRSVTRPVHGYVCLSCLVQGVEISSRVSRSYCDNAAAIPVKSIPPVPQIVPAVATPLKTKSHGESSDPPAIVLGGNENVYQGVDKEPEKSVRLSHSIASW